MNTLNFASEYASRLNLTFNIPTWHWIILISWFALLILGDLFLHRKDHVTTLQQATFQSFIWIGLSVGLGLLFWPLYGSSASAQFFSGYLIEKSLSIDNVFAWSIILSYFKIPKKYQHRVLFWGIFGALIMRIIFIFAGIVIIEKFEPILLIFGMILLYSGVKLLFGSKDHEFEPAKSRFLKIIQRVIPISHHTDGHNLFTNKNGKKVATILFLALIMVELTDVIFAIDSVPAILAVSRDPFIVFASNAAAILGLRALYFVFDKIKDKFWLLHKGLGFLLIAIGLKMFVGPQEIFGYKWFNIHTSNMVSLIIIGVLIGSIIALSLLIPNPHISSLDSKPPSAKD